MKTRVSHTVFVLCIVLCFSLLASPQRATGLAAPPTQSGDVATLTVMEAGLVWQPLIDATSWTLRVALPDGEVLERVFAAGELPTFALLDARGQHLPDGVYTYELCGSPPVATDLRLQLEALGNDVDRKTVIEELQKAGKLPAGPFYARGTFAIQGGEVFLPDPLAVAEPGLAPSAPQAPEDYMTSLYVDGSACIGNDCDNGEAILYDPLKLNDTEIRLFFEDSSTTGGVAPYNDWLIKINDTLAGGASYFAVQDISANTTPFKVAAGAPDNALYVASSGKIGLGTPIPSGNLTIQSNDSPNVYLYQTAAFYPAQLWAIQANDAIFWVNDVTNMNNPFKIETNAPTDSMYINDDGNVGIGTPLPLDKLHVEGNLRLQKTSTPSLLLVQSGGGAIPVQYWSLSATHERISLVDLTHTLAPFSIDTNSPTNSLYVASTGNVGIGTNDPAAKLQVTGGSLRVQNTAKPSLLLDQTGGADPAQLWSINASHDGIVFTDGSHGFAKPLIIETASPTNSLYVDSTGNVGVGTNAPASRLHVAGGLRADGFVVEDSSPLNTLYVDSTGRVGIGIASPAAKLHVNGDLQLEGFINERSDVAAKTAFVPVDGQDVLERLSAIPITTWSYKESPDVRHIGPMAQDFRAAYGFGPDDKHLAALDVNGVALASIQALDAQDKVLEAQNKELKAQVVERDAQIDELQERMQALEVCLAVRQVPSLWSALAPLVLGLLGLFIGARLARKR
jgi:hypothetical protein